MTKRKHDEVRSRNEAFTDKTATRIWHETPCDDNPYIASSALCHGYDLQELIRECSFVDVFYLLFRGELPSKEESSLLEALMIALINPGPRHAATRAAMNAGVGKTMPVHILPIALTVMGGEHLGGGEVEPAMRFLRKYQKQKSSDFFLSLEKSDNGDADRENTHPGFGSIYSGIDILTQKNADQLLNLPAAGKALKWGNELAKKLNEKSIGWLPTGLAAAVFADLGFQPKMGGALFQLLSAPGLAAHGLELSNKPITAMPYVRDENYVIEK
ncbi:MAG: citrate/2-methylcitrate synthase [Cellvibrionaceae bacterium]